MICAGEIWRADVGDESRRLVLVVSDVRFHRLADRAVVVPLVEPFDGGNRPWHIPHGDLVLTVDRFAAIATDRLLDVVDRIDVTTLLRVRRAISAIIS